MLILTASPPTSARIVGQDRARYNIVRFRISPEPCRQPRSHHDGLRSPSPSEEASRRISAVRAETDPDPRVFGQGLLLNSQPSSRQEWMFPNDTTEGPLRW